MNEFLDIFMEAGVDTLKLIPFLFLTYILMEWIEHRTGSHTQAAILRAGKAGPVFGGILGIVPQCGFSAAASNLYSGGLITAGALVAVFLSTSDEMLPIFISEAVPAWTIIKILAVKMVMGILFGFLLDFLHHICSVHSHTLYGCSDISFFCPRYCDTKSPKGSQKGFPLPF